MMLTQNHGNQSYMYTRKGLKTLVDKAGNSLFDTNNVKKNLFLTANELTSLKGCPKKVMGDFGVASNPLTSLEGGPEYVGEDCVVSGTQITSLTGAPKYIGDTLYAQDLDKLKDLKGVHRVIEYVRTLNLQNTKLKSHILGIFKIQGLQYVMLDDKPLMKICNEILDDLNNDDPDRTATDKLLDVQDRLIDAGFDDFALL